MGFLSIFTVRHTCFPLIEQTRDFGKLLADAALSPRVPGEPGDITIRGQKVGVFHFAMNAEGGHVLSIAHLELDPEGDEVLAWLHHDHLQIVRRDLKFGQRFIRSARSYPRLNADHPPLPIYAYDGNMSAPGAYQFFTLPPKFTAKVRIEKGEVYVASYRCTPSKKR